MSNNFKLRGLKLLHLLVSAGLFFLCWTLFYKGIYSAENRPKGDLVLYVYYTVLLFLLEKTYDAYDVGYHRVSDNIYSQALAQVLTGGLVWIVSILMYRMLTNPLPLLGLCAVQLAWNALWCVAANRGYQRLYAHVKTVVVYRNDRDLARLDEIYQVRDRFDIQRYIAARPEGDFKALEKDLAGFQAIIVFGVNASLRNGIAKYCIETGTEGYFAPHVGDIIMMGARHIRSFPVPVMNVRRVSGPSEYRAAKRAIDLAVSAAALLLLSPVFLASAMAIKLDDGGPVFYKQERLTRNGRVFRILKFRSMRTDAEKDGVARMSSGQNDDRITRVGRVIRACRLDELPQLINILKGEMTIVGPRPERPEIAHQYEEQIPAFSLRLQVKAGLTGYAQVYGKYNSNPYDKLEMDLMYINKMSIVEDLRLMFATVKILFLPESTEGVAVGATTAMDYESAADSTRNEAETVGK